MSRPSAPERAAARFALALVGALAVAVGAVPLALVVRAAWPPLVDADTAVTAAAERAVTGSVALLTVARVVTLLGDPAVLWAVALVVAALLAHRRAVRLAVFVLVVRLGAQLLSSGLKVAVDRARPVFDVPVDTALGASFPSGHTLGAAAVWPALAAVAVPLVTRQRRRLLLAAAAVIALLVATSRVVLGVHYLSDVVGGLLLGAGWAALCAAVVVRWRAEEERPVDPVRDGLEPGLGR